MPLIKATAAADMLKTAVILDLRELGARAADQAGRIEADLQSPGGDGAAERPPNADSDRRDGFAAGHAEGLTRGRAEALSASASELAHLQAAWVEALRAWEADRARLDAEAQRAVLAFALKLAEKLVHRIVKVDPSVVQDQLAAALAHVLSASEVTVRASPADRGLLEQAMPALVAEFPHLRHVSLVDDPQIAPGGCVVAYGRGQIDATLERQLQRITELMVPEDADLARSSARPSKP